MTIRRILFAGLMSLAIAAPLRADEATALRDALAEAGAGNWPAAQAAAQSAGDVGRDIVEWQRLRAGEGLLGDYEAFFQRRPDWPGLTLMKEKGEVAVARSTSADRVLTYFGADLPRSAAGALALVAALQGSGRANDAAVEAQRAWVALSFTPEEQAAMLALAPEVREAHELRLNRLLWADKRAEAARMLPLVSAGWQALAAARLGLRKDAGDVTALIKAVPADLAGDAGLAFDRFEWRMKKDLYPDAAALIIERSDSAARLGDAAAWADRRAVLARMLMRQGEAAAAYQVAARHQLTEGSDYADLEFLAGFIALRKLGDAAAALQHFGHLKQAVETPISLSRALYWEGRALEAKGSDATAAYTAAAQHQTAYYGQLAAERLGLTLDARLIDDTRPGDWRAAGFAQSSVLEAALLLLKAGDRTLAKRFVLHLAEVLQAADLDKLADLMLTVHEPHIAVLIAKQAAERGVILPRAYFPVVDLVPDGLAVSRALALSIARRESEFDPGARSSAGARGLMQVMPETGKMTAKALDLPFETSMLTADPAFNATIGAAYLAKLVAEFGPSIAMVASGYNAGPGRPRRWIGEFGDPRLPEVDVVDWVETIPFTETRTYVMRVVESVVIYRARLKGAVGPVNVTGELKG